MPDPTLKTISATQSAALFDISPYLTRWLLWRVFSGKDQLPELDAEENERMRFGKLLEPVVFDEAMRRLNIEGTYNATQEYVSHSREPIGCTPDGECYHPSKGRAVVQVKCVDWLVWKDHWTEDKPPPHIMAQVQHEMLVTDAAWACIPCLVGGNDLRLYEVFPDADFQAELLARVHDFMESIRTGEEPDPLGVPMEQPKLLERDIATVERVDLTTSEEAFNALQGLHYWMPKVSEGNKTIKNAKAKLLALSGNAERIDCFGYGAKIGYSQTRESAIELPPEIAEGLGSVIGSGILTGQHREAVKKALEWRHITRRGGVTTRWKVWDRDMGDEEPEWIEGYNPLVG